MPSGEPVKTPDSHAEKPGPTRPNLAQRQARARLLAVTAARTAADNRGQDVVVLDLRKLTPMFDYFVIATGTSEEIDDQLEHELGDRRMGIEGYDESRWILLDYGSVVVHLFDQPTRDYFALEQLWAEAPKIDWQQD